MLRNKHVRLDQRKIEKAMKILKAKTETETMDKALDGVLERERERLRKESHEPYNRTSKQPG
jgi:hypothetical protein